MYVWFGAFQFFSFRQRQTHPPKGARNDVGYSDLNCAVIGGSKMPLRGLQSFLSRFSAMIGVSIVWHKLVWVVGFLLSHVC